MWFITRAVGGLQAETDKKIHGEAMENCGNIIGFRQWQSFKKLDRLNECVSGNLQLDSTC